MKTRLLCILFPFIISIACGTATVKSSAQKISTEPLIQTAAAYKSAEHVSGNEWKLIFRKLDDCQYIEFYTDFNFVNALPDTLILSSENGPVTNPDYINLRYSIDYAEETMLNPVSGENVVVNRLKGIIRIKSDRFSVAGFDNDLTVDEFLIKLKQYVKTDSIREISELIQYPVDIQVKKKRLKISESDEFIKHYNTIFNRRVKNSILKQQLADVRTGSDGLIIGSGEITIKLVNEKVLITSINN